MGLSALMTTTVVSMEETIRQLRKKKPECKVMVGGAVLNQDYSDMIGADFYGKDAMQSVYYAQQLFGGERIDMSLILPENYDPHMTVRETQEAIKYIRDTFQREFGKEMNLERISAPLFVEKSSGLNDNLNGVERPVQFDVAGIPGETVEVVHSLAKWKRMALKKYDFEPGEGLYTNMNAIRRDEELDNLHSCYVDQWDWEKVIRKVDRAR